MKRYSSDGEEKIKDDKSFIPSQYQFDIFSWVDNNLGSGRSLVVQAVAGSGKSTVGVEIFKRLPKGTDSAFVAFNSHIAAELKLKLPADSNARTYHSLGFAAIRRTYSHVQVDQYKVDKIIRFLVPENLKFVTHPISKLVSLLKAALVAPQDVDNHKLQSLALDFDIDLYDETNDDLKLKIFAWTVQVLELSLEDVETVDFDDMIYLPAMLSEIRPHLYDFLFVDELQDTAYGQTWLAMHSIKPNGCIVGVGDVRQSIYAFRGADETAMAKFSKALNADHLPLSISYRCPVVIKDLVNQKFSDIDFEVPEWAIQGSINRLNLNKAEESIQPNDMVICRVNADLVPLAFSLIQRGVKATIRGRDIGRSIVTLVRKTRANDLPSMLSAIHDWQVKQVDKLMRFEKKSQIQLVYDKVSTIEALADNCNTVADLINACEAMFSDEKNGVTLSSIHKAKGLEADNVFILRPDLLPHPMAKTSTDLRQESNLEYVGITRAKSTLNFIG